MSRREKLIERIVKRPPEADFGDVRLLLEAFGWRVDRRKGSHVTVAKEDDYPITIPVHHDKVGRRYLEQICDRLGLGGRGD